jgi:predicted nucleic-acid-binding protein
MEKTNPYLRAAFMEVVDNQIASNDPPETHETLKRLTSEGISEEDAKLYIGQAVCIEVWDIMKHKREFNRERFVRNLKNLPEEPKE